MPEVRHKTNRGKQFIGSHEVDFGTDGVATVPHDIYEEIFRDNWPGYEDISGNASKVRAKAQETEESNIDEGEDEVPAPAAPKKVTPIAKAAAKKFVVKRK